MQEKLLKIIRDVLEDQNMEINKNDGLQALGIDSIKFIRIVIAIEDTFDIEVPDEYLLFSELNTLEKMENMLLTRQINIS